MVPPTQEQLDLMQVRWKADCAMRLAGDLGHERHRVGKDVWARCRSEMATIHVSVGSREDLVCRAQALVPALRSRAAEAGLSDIRLQIFSPAAKTTARGCTNIPRAITARSSKDSSPKIRSGSRVATQIRCDPARSIQLLVTERDGLPER
jgi:hypothetical protein